MISFPSWTTVFSVVFLGYVVHSLFSIAELFRPPTCSSSDHGKCAKSLLMSNSKMQLVIASSLVSNPRLEDLVQIEHWKSFNSLQELEKTLDVALSASVRRNGTAFLHLFLAPDDVSEWKRVLQSPSLVHSGVPLTEYLIQKREVIQLLGGEGSKAKVSGSSQNDKPVTHLRSKITFSIMTDDVQFPIEQLASLQLPFAFRFNKKGEYLPLLHIDMISFRQDDLIPVGKTNTTVKVQLIYKPISFGKLRLWTQFEMAFIKLKELGFSNKDVDEVKGILTDTNMVLLLVTCFISAVHLLLDFLAMKNDVSFWRSRDNMAGLSSRTLLWRSVSQTIIFFFLMDENTSLLILIPAGFTTLIEYWKLCRFFRVSITWKGIIPIPKLGSKTNAEIKTDEYDAEAMKYLSYLLYPLCFLGAVYSLLYLKHRSWYSWCIESLVNGVYAFGFLFMLPQLFVNYKLKSVAHLPWRSFMYKAFNTFIDDLFAFIITMPTAHRVACFRDDVVFLIYLYQRWLYPVDKSRIDSDVREEVSHQNGTKKLKKD